MWRLAVLVVVGCGRIEFDPHTPVAPVECLAPYVATGDSCYRIQIDGSSLELEWPAAEAKCEEEGGHLAIISNDQEHDVLASLFTAAVSDALIGASDRIVEGTYRSVDGKVLQPRWNGGQPDGGDGEDCLKIRDTAEVGDTSCTIQEDYICEIDGITVDRSAF